jgi:hypothetical protein
MRDGPDGAERDDVRGGRGGARRDGGREVTQRRLWLRKKDGRRFFSGGELRRGQRESR